MLDGDQHDFPSDVEGAHQAAEDEAPLDAVAFEKMLLAGVATVGAEGLPEMPLQTNAISIIAKAFYGARVARWDFTKRTSLLSRRFTLWSNGCDKSSTGPLFAVLLCVGHVDMSQETQMEQSFEGVGHITLEAFNTPKRVCTH